MADFILRNVDDSLWSRFKQRSKSDGHTMRWVLLSLVESYIAHGLPARASPSSAPRRPRTGVVADVR